MLLRLPLVLFILLLSIVGCEQQGKGTNTSSSHAAPTTPSTPADKKATDVTKDTTPKGGANETQPGAEKGGAGEPAGGAEATEPNKPAKEKTPNNAH